MNRMELENRIKEIDNVIVQQGQTAQQINNNILMLHGAKQELEVHVKRFIEEEQKVVKDKSEKNEEVLAEI